MSGYLRRLARRTLRATPTVHSVAALPYATGSRPEPPGPVFDGPPGIDDPATRPTETVPSPIPDRRAPSQIGSRSAFDAAATSMPVAGPEPVAAASAGLAEDPPEAAPGRLRPAQEDPGPSAPPSLPAERSTRAVDPPGRQGHYTAPLDPGPAILIPRPRPAVVRKGRGPVSARVEPAAPSSPGALAVSQTPSRVVTTDAMPVGLGTRDRPARAARSAGEPTEIHVTIGRIEVTAVREAPPPKRQAAKANKPMTLDEYLARRQGRLPSSH